MSLDADRTAADDLSPATTTRRRGGDVVWLDDRQAWCVLSYPLASAVLRDPARFSSDLRPAATGDGPDATTRRVISEAPQMLFRDPPDHTRLRAAASPWFTPRAVGQLRGLVDDCVTDALDGLPAGPFDVLADYAYLVPIAVMASLLDVGAEGAELFLRHTPAIARLLDNDASTEDRHRGLAAGTDLTLFLLPIAAERRHRPGDDLLSQLGAPEAGLELDEVVSQAMLLLAAGHETTAHLIANAMRALLLHPDQRALLAEPGADWPRAVTELARYDSPVQTAARRAVTAVRLGDRDLDADDVVLVSIGAANRDPGTWADPDRLDLTRTGTVAAVVRRRPALLPGRLAGRGGSRGRAPRPARPAPRAGRDRAAPLAGVDDVPSHGAAGPGPPPDHRDWPDPQPE